jgi:hypothetical protein
VSELPQTRIVTLLRGIGLVLIGAIVLGLSLLELRSIQDFVAQARSVEGTVVGLTAGPAHSEIRFVDPISGEPVTVPGNGLGASHHVGESVKVLVRHRSGVTTAKLDEPGPLWGFCLMTVVTGLALMLGGVFTLRRRSDTRAEAGV